VSQYIKIEGSAVQLVDERMVRTVPLDAYLAALASQNPQVSPLLPQGCRMYSRGSAGELFVVEQGPRKRTITWKSTPPWGDSAKRTWQLAFPYVVFIAKPVERVLYVFYRNAPLGSGEGSLAEELYSVNLGNVYLGRQNVCLAERARPARGAPPPAPEGVDELITGFWASEFNDDLLDYFFRMSHKYPEKLGTLMAWEKASMEDPLFVLSTEWERTGTLSEKVAQHAST